VCLKHAINLIDSILQCLGDGKFTAVMDFGSERQPEFGKHKSEAIYATTLKL